MDESSAALEQFRQQWKEEVSARSKQPDKKPQESRSAERARRPSDVRVERPIHKPPTRHPAADIKDDSDHYDDAGQKDASSSSMIQRIEGLSIRHVDDDDFSAKASSKEPKSALEHFERAVEKESQGNLGDSLSHYRKAYRLDAKVDQSYKNKHFPTKSKPTNPNPSNASATVPSTAHHSSEGPQETMTMSQLIETFADAQIIGAPPLIEGDIPPHCGIKDLPTEVLLELLQAIGIRDPALLMRLSLVCKKLAYHLYKDNALWKRVALGPEFGLAGQRYNFVTDLQGRESVYRVLEEDDGPIEDPSSSLLSSVVTDVYFPKETIWQDIFHNYPRIRYTGVYISTVNYTRAGGSSATANTWSNPIHIITYYRYLRFFRDGTCISLLTTNEPIEVVHHLTKENLTFVRAGGKKETPSHPLNFTSSAPALFRESGNSSAISSSSGLPPPNNAAAPPPSAQQIMKHALRGRWRLCHPSLDTPTVEATPTTTTGTGTTAATNQSPTPPISPGDLHIETEGAGPRYMYTMHLSLKSAGSARSKHTTKNNKLQWKGFWSFNVLTSDWAEFHLKNDKPFFFSRVRGYGLGY
jgi:F-box protein 9